jgi:hypothetical protein
MLLILLLSASVLFLHLFWTHKRSCLLLDDAVITGHTASGNKRPIATFTAGKSQGLGTLHVKLKYNMGQPGSGNWIGDCRPA